MRSTFRTVVLLALFSSVAYADELHFATNGYSIKALEGNSDAAVQQALMMFLPANNGFAPNVNVQLQKFDNSMATYLDVTKQQFATNNMKILSQKMVNPNTLVLEYTGFLQGNDLHFYARAELARGKVYLVTATARDTDWKQLAPRLREVVDSFKLDKK